MHPLIQRVLGEAEAVNTPDEQNEVHVAQQIQQQLVDVQNMLLRSPLREEDPVFTKLQEIYRLAGQILSAHQAAGREARGGTTHFTRKTASAMRQV